jgi:signal transduction histidine kinase
MALRLPTVPRFAVLSLVCVVGLALVMGFTISSLLTRAMSEWEWENTAAFVRAEMELGGLTAFFTSPRDAGMTARWGAEVSRRLATLPEVVRLKAWDRNATVVWSDEPDLIGRRFPDNGELHEALDGRVAVEIAQPAKSEHDFARGVPVLATIYVPIFAPEGGQVLGVLEVYKTPHRLFATIRRARILIWAISLGGALVLWLVLLPLVRQVYGREVREATLRAHAGRLEAKVAERAEQLLQSQKMDAIGRLAGGVAHDFNNLLTVIIGRAELLLVRMGGGDRLRGDVETIRATAERAAALTHQLLAFSRRQVLRPEVVDLNAVVSRMEVMLRQLIGEDVALAVTLAPRRPRVKADATQLEQVIMNLAVNARDAMPRGGRLTLETAEADADARSARCLASCHPTLTARRCALLSVNDTGMGIDAATRARIFEPFFTTKDPGKGTGLGLSTVYGIVQQSGGSICVHSDPGAGATFNVYLPAVADEAPVLAPRSPMAEP